jgi:hypothetical protein
MEYRSQKTRKRKSPSKTQIIDLTGQTFNHFVVLKRVENDLHNNPQWLCKCVCGIEIIVLGSSLRCNRTKSCGCKRKKDLTGQMFGRLTVISFAGYYDDGKKKRTKWNCSCSCNGNTSSYLQGNLVQGSARSCGCLKKENYAKQGETLKKWNQNPDNKEVWRNVLTKSLKYGVEHHCYNHSLTTEEREASRRRMPMYKTWCKSIYKRDNYSCKKCNKKHCKLEAHHIKSYKLFPDLRFDINNGVCLCTECHLLLHQTYGKILKGDSYMKEFLPNFQLVNS